LTVFTHLCNDLAYGSLHNDRCQDNAESDYRLHAVITEIPSLFDKFEKFHRHATRIPLDKDYKRSCTVAVFIIGSISPLPSLLLSYSGVTTTDAALKFIIFKCSN